MELVQIDIAFEVSALLKFPVAPFTGHLVQALHVLKWLDIHKEDNLDFHTLYHDVESDKNIHLNIQTMVDIYFDAEEDVPTNSPEPQVYPGQINVFFGSDHSGGIITIRSHSGNMMYLNISPIYW